MLNISKTVKMKRMLFAIKKHLIGFPHWDDKLAKLCEHVGNVAILQEEQNGMIYEKVVKKGNNAPDHYACALAYALIGVDKLSNLGVIFQHKPIMDFYDLG